jgi:outer membrane PBP1 activator LpoA protein
MGVSDNSGVLYLKGSQQIERVLAWGQFKHGLAQQVGKPSVAF